MNYKYFRIEKIGEKPKTSIYGIFTNSTNALIGTIKWNGNWRQYILDCDNSIWSKGCLLDIIDFIDKLSTNSAEKGEEIR